MQQPHGSGKTAVLVERIINKILKENIDIDKLLVVTFTNAAASEIKQRVLDAIYKELEKNPDNENLQKQILLLGKASICTIDSFCLDVVKNNFYELKNVSPNFRIADTTEIDILEQETLDEMFEKKYENEDKEFLDLVNIYTNYKDDSPLKELILKIFTQISSMPFPMLWLEKHVEMFNIKDSLEDDFANTPWGKIILKDIEEEIVDDLSVIKNLKKQVSRCDDFENVENVLEQDINYFETLIANLASWDNIYTIFHDNKFARWKAPKSSNPFKDDAKNIRDSVKEKFNNYMKKIMINDSKQSNADIYDMYETLVKLQNLIQEFEKEFTRKKQERNIVDFSDVEHYALNILLKIDENGNYEKTDVAKMYASKFEEIAIDEYQDSNYVQEYILSSVSRQNNMYMVGDVKQSIYKFRQAVPKLFLDKYEKYKFKSKKEIDGQDENFAEGDLLNNNSQNLEEMKYDIKIQLFKNFRSRKNVLDFTNLIFQNIMSKQLGNVDYNEDEYLYHGAKDYKDTDQNLKTQMLFINLKEDEESQQNYNYSDFEDDNEELDGKNKDEDEEKYENIELEAKLVANKIEELIKNKYQVYDRKKEKFRDIKYSDIVVLLRSTKNKANIFEQEMIDKKIPVFSDTSQEYLDSIEIQTIISLLKIIDNPMQDIPLVTVMRSNIGKFSDNDLVKIRLNDRYDNFYTCLLKSQVGLDDKLKEKVQKFLGKIKMWRKDQEYLALDELIWKIYSDTGFYNYAGLMPNGILRQANLKALFEKAKQYESASFKGLYNFINFIDKLKLGSGDLGSAKLIGDNDDVVRIMSIHKSKGLEFPVVFLSNVGKEFNMQSIRTDKILLDDELGLGMKYINNDIQIEYNTNAKIAVKNKLEMESFSEEMRVLYVALTRAKEKLFITGFCKDYEKKYQNLLNQSNIFEKKNNKINYILLKKCKSYLDWILQVYCYEKEKFEELTQIEILTKDDILEKNGNREEEKNDIIKKINSHKVDKEELEKVKKDIEFKYNYKLSTITPTKTSVSEIKRKYQEEVNKNEEELKVEEQLNDDMNKSKSFKENINLAKPKFLKVDEDKALTGAQKGTLIHMCLQKLDENTEYNKEKIDKMLNDMFEKGVITLKEKKSINVDKILKFTKSSIWNELKKAKKVFKEKPFYIEVKANELVNENNDDNILVQGIIDLYYINQNNEIVLVDYKTDYIKDGNIKTLVDKYKKQLELYKLALEKATDKKVAKTLIYSVYLEKEIELKI